MKILVCGNGPSLLTQLKNRNLNEFDKVVRVNAWEEIKNYDNRCDVWVFYPWHHLGYPENKYDITAYLNKDIKEFWIVHEFTLKDAIKILGGFPTYVLDDYTKNAHSRASGLYTPRTGILALWLAAIFTEDIWAAGFDFYQGEQSYYYKEGKSLMKPEKAPMHPHPLKEKEWFDKQVGLGKIKVL